MTTEPTPAPEGSSQVLAALERAGYDPETLFAPPPADGSSGADLGATMMQTAYEMSAPWLGALPWWVQSAADEILSRDQFGGAYGAGEQVVYLGSNEVTATTVDPANKFASETDGRPGDETTSTKVKPFAVTMTAAQNLPYGWDEQEVADAIERMKAAGLNVTDFEGLTQAWGMLVNRAAATYTQTDGERKLTPWDVLDLYKSEAVAAGTYVDPNRTETTTSRNVTEITEGQAWSAIQGTLSQMLGRDPSDQELRDFTYRMNRMAASNPSISTTITQYKDGSAVSSSTHTDPGYTAQDLAQDAYDTAQDDPEYAEYRGASYLFNAVQSALGPIGG
jgi:hypothetical protein